MKLLQKYRANYKLLRKFADDVGRAFEAKPYSALAGGSADESYGSVECEGATVAYAAYSVEIKQNGDVRFCIDIYSELPTLLGIKPSYEFYKRRDGSVYYD